MDNDAQKIAEAAYLEAWKVKTNALYNVSHDIGNKYYPEDYTKFDPAYDNIKKYIYTLTEILGSETLREYHFNQSTDYLVTKMMEYVPDEGGCYKLISDISYLGNFDEDIRETEETRYEVENTLSQLYLNKYGTDMSTNLEIMAHLHPEEVAQYLDYNDEYEVISKSVEVNTQKAYFNTDAITYLQDSTYNYVRNVANYNNIMSLDTAISSGLVQLIDGQYKSVNDSVTILEDGTVSYNMQVATLTDMIDIDNTILINNSVRTR